MNDKRVKFKLTTAKCGMCMRRELDTVNTAVKYCKTCQEFLCQECLKRHRRLVVAENHKILNRDHMISDDTYHNRYLDEEIQTQVTEFSAAAETVLTKYAEYRKQTMEALNEVNMGVKQEDLQEKEEDTHEPKHYFTEVCDKHSDEKIKFYCVSHKVLCCDVCKLSQHQACMSNVKFILEEVQTKSLLSGNNATYLGLNDNISKFKEYDHNLKRDLRELKKSKENFLRDLSAKKREVLNWVNLMEVRAVRRLEIVFDKCKRDIDIKRKTANAASEKLRAESYFLQGILENKNNDDIYKFIKEKQAEKLIRETDKEIVGVKRTFTNTRFSLDLDEDFRSVMTGTNQLYDIKFEVKGEDKFNVRLKGDQHTSNITGCTCLASGDLVLADRSNAKIKIFGPHMKLISSFKVVEGVFDVTDITSHTIAVTSPLKAKINIIELTQSKFKSTKIVSTGNGTCWGVKHIRGKFVVNVSTTEASYVRVLTEDGEIVAQIETQCGFYSAVYEEARENLPPVSIITAASYIMAPKDEQKIMYYVEENKGANEFQILEYNYLNHLHIKGVAVDRSGNPVVCCHDTDQIYTISKTGVEVELLLAESDGVCRPQAICYTQNKSKLVVSSEYTDFIQIFTFDVEKTHNEL